MPWHNKHSIIVNTTIKMIKPILFVDFFILMVLSWKVTCRGGSTGRSSVIRLPWELPYKCNRWHAFVQGQIGGLVLRKNAAILMTSRCNKSRAARSSMSCYCRIIEVHTSEWHKPGTRYCYYMLLNKTLVPIKHKWIPIPGNKSQCAVCLFR